jgi:glycosyltransferase involved in cell wall biosynthesis
MKVIHVPFCFAPDPIGGTEVYVEALATEQQRRGLDVLVAAPAAESSRYVHSGLEVCRFAVSAKHDLGSLYGDGDDRACAHFERIVDEERPDLVHLHAFTSAVSARLARMVRQRGARLVFTYHTPTVSCPRGTLLHWGDQVCDGLLEVHRCASCTLHALGLDRTAGELLGSMPAGVGRAVGGLGLAGRSWTALRMSHLIQRQHAALRSFMDDMDMLVVLCEWARELLLRNGVSPDQLTLSRHGIAQVGTMHDRVRIGAQQRGTPLRIAFFGRLHPTKGVDVLLRAIVAEPALDLRLHIYGMGEPAYVDSLHRLAAYDPRISFLSPVPSTEVPATLREYDVLAVPSQWLETGPLVVLEAFAAGTPVLGSNRGGILELVEHGRNGLLVEAASVEAWRSAIRRMAESPDLLRQLRAGIHPPRYMGVVADEMVSLYQRVVLQATS